MRYFGWGDGGEIWKHLATVRQIKIKRSRTTLQMEPDVFEFFPVSSYYILFIQSLFFYDLSMPMTSVSGVSDLILSSSLWLASPSSWAVNCSSHAVDMLNSCPLHTPLHGQLFSMSVSGLSTSQHLYMSRCCDVVKIVSGCGKMSTACLKHLQNVYSNSL